MVSASEALRGDVRTLAVGVAARTCEKRLTAKPLFAAVACWSTFAGIAEAGVRGALDCAIARPASTGSGWAPDSGVPVGGAPESASAVGAGVDP
jgi:hypothetical protein